MWRINVCIPRTLDVGFAVDHLSCGDACGIFPRKGPQRNSDIRDHTCQITKLLTEAINL